ncbi:unnamed protein product [Musa acuminata subsp. malaccensis]|uniref:(wild Malaysian banana) hypothetical protein n=1 Tax=Musa acuminata subsp. malaccensis TaxID=214687 RepID=A0A8D7F7X7_MUSAM|nr:unnamed protein product [Musa acuminata subsp. malaccensis]
MYIDIEINKNTKTHQKIFFGGMRMNQNYSIILNLKPSFFLEFVLSFDA